MIKNYGNVAMYVRFSDVKQRDYRQTSECYKYLEGSKYNLKIFKEKPMSGATDPYKRPELMSAIEWCRENNGTLIMADLERLCRRMWQTLRFFDEVLTRYKINLIVCNDPNISNDRQRLSMKAMYSDWERQRISERTRNTLEGYKRDIEEKGYFISKDGRKLTRLGVQGPSEKANKMAGQAVMLEANRFANTIRLLVSDAYTHCKSLQQMAQYLNDRHIETPRGGKWYASSVRNVINRLNLNQGSV